MVTKIESRITPLTIISFLMVALWLVIAMFPFIWTLWGSFKVQADFFSRANWTNAIYGVHTIKQTDFSTIITTKSGILRTYTFNTIKQNNEYYNSITNSQM